MAERVKDHFGQASGLPQLVKLLRDHTLLALPPIGQCHHQIVVLILVAEQRTQLVLRGFLFSQDMSQSLGQPHLADTGIRLGLFQNQAGAGVSQ